VNTDYAGRLVSARSSVNSFNRRPPSHTPSHTILRSNHRDIGVRPRYLRRQGLREKAIESCPDTPTDDLLIQARAPRCKMPTTIHHRGSHDWNLPKPPGRPVQLSRRPGQNQRPDCDLPGDGRSSRLHRTRKNADRSDRAGSKRSRPRQIRHR